MIALSAEAMNALDAVGVSYRTPEDYIASSAVNLSGITVYDGVAAYCRTLDQWLAERMPESAALRPATTCFYEFKILHDTLTLRAMEIDAVLAAEQPARVFAARAVPEADGLSLAFNVESAYSRVLKTRGVSIEWWGSSAGPVVPLKQQKTMKSMVPAEWRQRLSLFRAAGLSGFGQNASRETVLLLNITPDIRAAMRSPEAEGLRFVHWQGTGHPLTVRPLRMRGDARLERVALPSAPDDQPPSGLVSESLEPIARERIARFVQRDVCQLMAAAAQARQVIAHYKPVSSVAGILAGPRARGAAVGVRAAGVPLTLCQHGGSYGYIDHPVHYFNDLMQADRFVTYGNGVNDDLLARHGARRPIADLLSAGSASLAQVTPAPGSRGPRKQALGFDARPLVVYVGTCLMGQRFYAPHYRACEYFALLCDAARALGSLPRETQVVLKTHQRGDNAFNPIEDWCRRHAPSVRVVSTGGLAPWLDAADAVALDLPGTPLIEALAHRVPVLAYLPPETFRLSAPGERLMRAAIALETSRAGFLDKLARLPGSAKSGAIDPFLSSYGTRAAAPASLARAMAHSVDAPA